MTQIAQIKSQTDLLALIGNQPRLRKVAGTNGGEWAGPCPFCGLGHDRFRVQPNHTPFPRWYNRGGGELRPSCTCNSNDGRWHSAIDFVMFQRGYTFPQAINLLGSGELPTLPAKPRQTAPQTAVSTASKPPDQAWQNAVLEPIYDCCQTLHSQETPEARAAYDYLVKHRGLSKETIFGASLGYNPQWRKITEGAWLPPGITIPCLVGPDVWYIQVRTTKAARRENERRGRKLDKYHALGGSRLSALYGAGSLKTAENGIVVEGEFDALLLQQALGPGVGVVTLGSASSKPDMRWGLHLSHLQRLFVTLDSDQAGAAGLAAWSELVPFCEPLPAVPEGKDITDYWQQGGDLRAWYESVANGQNVNQASILIA